MRGVREGAGVNSACELRGRGRKAEGGWRGRRKLQSVRAHVSDLRFPVVSRIRV